MMIALLWESEKTKSGLWAGNRKYNSVNNLNVLNVDFPQMRKETKTLNRGPVLAIPGFPCQRNCNVTNTQIKTGNLLFRIVYRYPRQKCASQRWLDKLSSVTQQRQGVTGSTATSNMRKGERKHFALFTKCKDSVCEWMWTLAISNSLKI